MTDEKIGRLLLDIALVCIGICIGCIYVVLLYGHGNDWCDISESGLCQVDPKEFCESQGLEYSYLVECVDDSGFIKPYRLDGTFNLGGEK